MNTKEKHLEYLNKKGRYRINCSKEIFSKKEIDLLIRFGYWLEGLSNGDLLPFTEEQKDFLKVIKGEKEPTTFHEKTWFKYISRKRLELEHPDKFNLNFKLDEDTFFTRKDYYKLHPYRKPKY